MTRVPAPSQSDEADAKALTISILSDCAMRFMEGPQPNIDRAIALGTKIALDALATVHAEATLAEREACARVADDYARWGEHNQPAQIPAREIAAAIRGEK